MGQALAWRRQVAQTQADDRQALLLPDLHRMIDEPGPVLSVDLGHGQRGVPQAQQPQAPGSPMRRGHAPTQDLRQQGQDACRTAQRCTGQYQTHEQDLHADAIGVRVDGIVSRIEYRRQLRLFFPPRPVGAGPRCGLPVLGAVGATSRLPPAIWPGSYSHRAHDSAGVWPGSSCPGTCASNGPDSGPGTRLELGERLCTVSSDGPLDLPRPWGTPFRFSQRGPPENKSATESKRPDKAKTAKTSGAFISPAPGSPGAVGLPAPVWPGLPGTGRHGTGPYRRRSGISPGTEPADARPG